MTKLLVGFDSAWTLTHKGALVGALQRADGKFHELGLPEVASFERASEVITGWQREHAPAVTIVSLDQPTIVTNEDGQRAVENLVASPVSRRYGGMQPANRGRREMFGDEGPVWKFLEQFGGAADPLQPAGRTWVFETYPVLALIALGWLLPDARPTGRLPKYNPQRRKTFRCEDWQYLCAQTSGALRERGLAQTAEWIEEAGKTRPQKSVQDRVDACLCLLVALHLTEGRDCLMVGEMATGYIVVPYGAGLQGELMGRCGHTKREPAEWVRTFRLSAVVA
jgi:predicted RNase H-like nuclease